MNWKKFLKYLIAAIAGAITSYFSASCTAGVVIGSNQRQYQEQTVTTNIDSLSKLPTLQIR